PPSRAPSPCRPSPPGGPERRSYLRPELVAQEHADHDRERVGHARESPDGRSHVVADRVATRAQGDRLFEHQQERDQCKCGRDEGDDGLGCDRHGFMPCGDVRPHAGPHRKCPSRMPITTAMTNAAPGYEWTEDRM